VQSRIPSRDLVIVQRVDAATRPEGIRPADTRALFQQIVAAVPRRHADRTKQTRRRTKRCRVFEDREARSFALLSS